MVYDKTSNWSARNILCPDNITGNSTTQRHKNSAAGKFLECIDPRNAKILDVYGCIYIYILMCMLLKGYRPCRRPLSVHERDLHREGTSTIRSMSLRGPCCRKVQSLLLSYDRPKVWSFSLFICSSYIYIHSTYTVHIYVYIYIYITAEQQQDSCPNHAKQRPRTMPKCCLRNALGAEWASKTFGGRLWSVKYQKLASQAFGGPLPKQPNSSRIRVQTMRNSDHAQCRNVAYETH